MLRKLYDWTLSIAAHRHARWWLAAISFAESSFFPVPPDVALMPMVLAERKRAFEYALICTIASVLGGIAGYAIGYFLFDTVGAWILDVYGYHEKFAAVQESYNAYGAWNDFTAGLPPIPYKIFTIASGVTQLNLAVFFIASCAARGLRFFAVAALLWWFGPPIRAFIDKYFGLLSILFVILLIGGFLAVSLVL